MSFSSEPNYALSGTLACCTYLRSVQNMFINLESPMSFLLSGPYPLFGLGRFPTELSRACENMELSWTLLNEWLAIHIYYSNSYWIILRNFHLRSNKNLYITILHHSITIKKQQKKQLNIKEATILETLRSRQCQPKKIKCIRRKQFNPSLLRCFQLINTIFTFNVRREFISINVFF